MRQPVNRSVDRHLPALEGLRGVAVLLVMLYHFAGSISTLGFPVADRLPFRLGWAGVDVFFTLSGFLITSILLDSKGKTAFFRNFCMRRILRICPLYYGGILVVALLRLAMGGDPIWGTAGGLFAPSSLVWPMAYLENLALALRGQAGIPCHYWSLAVEEHFYLFWPLAVWACSRRQLAMIAGLAIAGQVLLRAGVLLGGGEPAALMGMTPLRLDSLALGALASLAVHAKATVAVLGAGLIVSLAEGASVASRALGTGRVHWLGMVSYSLYLMHCPIHWGLNFVVRDLLEALGARRPAALASLVLVALSVALAAAGYRWIERHCRNLPRRILGAMHPVLAPAGLAPAGLAPAGLTPADP